MNPNSSSESSSNSFSKPVLNSPLTPSSKTSTRYGFLKILGYLLRLPFRVLHALISVSVISFSTLILFPFFLAIVLIDIKKAYVVQFIWARIFVFICGVRLDIYFEQPIPKTGVIVLFNHSTFLDIPILVLVTQRFMFYVAKKELEKLPVLGTCFKLVKTLMMPRNDLQASIQLYDEAKVRLKQGDSFVIAPEGGRNKNLGISDFKSGPFIFAMSSQADLIPIIMKGGRDLWPPEHVLPNLRQMTSLVKVHVGSKISTKDWTEENRKAKMQELKNRFEELYHSL